MITLEPITPANVPLLRTTRLNALQDSPNAYGSTYARESQFSEADWLKRAMDWSSDGSAAYLAMIDGAPCGIVAGFLDNHDQDKAHVISMWVAPTHRRKGIGHILIGAIEAWAGSHGRRTLRLTVTSNNLTAIQFYERNGFSMTGNTEPYPNDPALMEFEMSRPIPAKV